MLRMLGLGRKSLSEQLKAKLPVENVFVDVVVTGGPRGSVCVETIDDRTFSTGKLDGLRPGQTVVVSYQNTQGRFRLSTECVAVAERLAVFAIPQRIETLQLFTGARSRAAVRLDTTVPCQWRYAPDRQGTGEYVRASLTDISRSGASLIVDRDVKRGTYVEVRFSVSTAASPLLLIGEVLRISPTEASKKVSLGLQFHGITSEEDRAIVEFINKRQAERRNRGLV